MWLIDLASLLFGVAMVGMLVQELKDGGRPGNFTDYCITVGMACGGSATIWVAGSALVKAVL